MGETFLFLDSENFLLVRVILTKNSYFGIRIILCSISMLSESWQLTFTREEIGGSFTQQTTFYTWRPQKLDEIEDLEK